MEPATIPVSDHPGALALPEGVAAVSALPLSECERRLQLWVSVGGRVDDEGFNWPSGSAIRQTEKILLELNDSPRPMFMAPDGDGGVSLEWRAGNDSTRVLIDSDGGVIQRRFRDSLLIDTRQW